MDQDKYQSDTKLMKGQDHTDEVHSKPVPRKSQNQIYNIQGLVDKALDNQKPTASQILGLDGGNVKKVSPENHIDKHLNELEGDISEDEGSKGLEDVRMSNFAYSQTKISEYISFYFAMLGVGCHIVANEIYAFNNLNDVNKTDIVTMITIGNVSTFFLIMSTIAGYLLYVRWKITKNYYTKMDNVINTGLWKPLVFQCMLTFIQMYPSLYGETYIEEYNTNTTSVIFITNDILLCFMIFARFHYLLETILQISFFTDPRSQRVCQIYGADADNLYAIKAIMVNDSWIVVLISTFISLIMFSYQLRLFERFTNSHFIHITSCMWNMFITMTTVGYGDIFALSHLGRFIAIVAAFWGVFLNSLFILSLTNSLNLNSSEQKAYNLLQRLIQKDTMRKQAVDMLSLAFKIKKIRDRNPNPDINEINQLQRCYKKCSDEFNRIRKSLRNTVDFNADMDSIKMAVDQIDKGISEIRQSIPKAYQHLLFDPKKLSDIETKN